MIVDGFLSGPKGDESRPANRKVRMSDDEIKSISPAPPSSSTAGSDAGDAGNVVSRGLRRISTMIGARPVLAEDRDSRRTSGALVGASRKTSLYANEEEGPAMANSPSSSFTRKARDLAAPAALPAPAAEVLHSIEDSPADAALAAIAQPMRYDSAESFGGVSGSGGEAPMSFIRRGSQVMKSYLFRAPMAAPEEGKLMEPSTRRRSRPLERTGSRYLAPVPANSRTTGAEATTAWTANAAANSRQTIGNNSVGGGMLQPNPPSAADMVTVAGGEARSKSVNRRILAPFRRKSLVSRVLLGDKASTTANPERQGLDWLVIHPKNRLKVAFDVLVQALTLYSLATVPINFSFGAGAPPTFDLFVDMVFVADVILHFFHGSIERGYPVLSLERVAYDYFRSWFLIELVAALPYDLMSSNRDWSALSLLRCIRLRKLGLIIANSRIGTTSSGLAAFLNVFIIVGAWVLVAHCFACVFFALGWRLRCQGDGYEQTWLDLLEHPVLDLPTCDEVALHYPGGAWNATAAQYFRGRDSPGGAHWLNLWVLTLHWAISSMSSLGYGRGPMAVTMPEFLFTTFCQVLGACLYAAIFGNIAQLLAKLDAPGARYRAQRDKIDEFVSFHELPSKLTSKLHAYCKFLFAVNHGFDVGQISGALPPNLQHQLLLHLHAPLVKAVPMFEDCDDAFIKAIVLQLRPQVLLGGDAAFKAAEVGTEMYFIQRGEMRMMDQTMTVCYNALYSGAYFGELAMLTGQPRTATALAVTDCVLFYINQSDFNLVARKWPKALATILAKAKERLERINNANSKSLAAQLGERLGDIHAVLAETADGIVGLAPSCAAGMRSPEDGSFRQPLRMSSPDRHSRPESSGSFGRLTRMGGSLEGTDGERRTIPGDGSGESPQRKTQARRSIAALVGGDANQSVLQQAAFQAWQSQIERQVAQSNEGVQMILERIGLVFNDNGSGTSSHLVSGSSSVLGANTVGGTGGGRKKSTGSSWVNAPALSA